MYRAVIIDDEQWSREVIKNLVEWEKFEIDIIDEANDGRTGIKLIEEIVADIVITDMRMPGLDGVELLKTLNKKFPELMIVVMSGYDDFEYLQQAIRSRAIEYLLKPINEEELNNSLRRCIKELHKKNSEKLVEVSKIFESIDDLDKYLAYQQRIYDYLLEINKPMVLNTFRKLAEFLKNSSLSGYKNKFLNIIFNDYKLIITNFLEEKYNNSFSIDEDQIAMIEVVGNVDDLIEKLSNIFISKMDKVEKLVKNRGQLSIEEIQKYVDKHYQDDISLEMLAQHFFISKEHLSRKFKEETGENISNYITKKRMHWAKELILERDLSLKDVSEIVGYNDISYFYRVFKKFYGITPGVMRENN